MVANLTKSMNNMCISLTDRINILESNLSKDLAILIEKKVKHDIGQPVHVLNLQLLTGSLCISASIITFPTIDCITDFTYDPAD
jgi:hypothetical protein